MDGRAESRGYARILAGVRLTLLLACAGLLLFFHGDLSARLAGANEDTASTDVPDLEREQDIAQNWASAQWKLREAAVMEGNAHSLSLAVSLEATDPVMDEDQMSDRWGRPYTYRSHRGFQVLLASPDALTMVAIFNVSQPPGWGGATTERTDRALVAFVRENVESRWRIAMEVPWRHWPWKVDDIDDVTTANRRTDVDPEIALRPHLRGRPLLRTVSVPLQEGRTLVCGAVGAWGASPADQYCVLAPEARPDDSYYVGSVRSK